MKIGRLVFYQNYKDTIFSENEKYDIEWFFSIC